jgi:hypothetical protein
MEAKATLDCCGLEQNEVSAASQRQEELKSLGEWKLLEFGDCERQWICCALPVR